MTGAQTFTLMNTGGSPAAPVITLAGSSEFAIAPMSDMCTATVLEPGDSCTVEVQLVPTTTGAVTASLKATSKKPAATATASLSGTGTFPSLRRSDRPFADQQRGRRRTVARARGKPPPRPAVIEGHPRSAPRHATPEQSQRARARPAGRTLGPPRQ